MVYISLAFFLEDVERVQFGTHEGEYGLLFVPQPHAHSFSSLRDGRELLYYLQLQPVEVLHLIHLNPRIAFERRIILERRIGELQEIFEVEQIILLFISSIGMCIPHLHEALLSLVLENNGKDGLIDEIEVIIRMIIDICHQRCIEQLVRSLGDSFQRSDVLGSDTLGMDSQHLRYPVDDVVHQVREEHDLCMRPFASEVTSDEIFVLIKVTRQNTVCCVVIDDGALRRNDTIGEEETGTEAMDVSYKHILRFFHSHPFIDTFAHAPCRTVCEGETQHILRLDTLSECLTDPLGKDLRLATPRRSENKMFAVFEC